MQIELIGCTSAGKSTLKKHIIETCRARQLSIWDDKAFVLRQFGLSWIKSELLRTLLVDVLALIACAATVRRNLQFYGFTRLVLRQLPLSMLGKFYILRNVLRKLGKHEIIHAYAGEEQMVLVDEGVLQVAHNLFVHVAGPAATAAHDVVATFARLAPQPDAIVYLRQPTVLLTERIMQRGHKRIAEHTVENVERFVELAVATFETLAQQPGVKQKALVIEGEKVVIPAAEQAADSLVGLMAEVLQDSISRSATCATHSGRAHGTAEYVGHRASHSALAELATRSDC